MSSASSAACFSDCSACCNWGWQECKSAGAFCLGLPDPVSPPVAQIEGFNLFDPLPDIFGGRAKADTSQINKALQSFCASCLKVRLRLFPIGEGLACLIAALVQLIACPFAYGIDSIKLLAGLFSQVFASGINGGFGANDLLGESRNLLAALGR
ncbi:hypothetical protein [uncultured Cohaesibacter sp.]|uniref:hypothetical protein n=1 Tax=uncultured Cohaesibacter sp. TaxID=1002546 RepID=UPI002AA91EE0|nr:hypothetical protein [uncultured Cohaesibacter sp.]